MTNRTTRIGWIRHGVTDWNSLGKIQGVTDIPLNEEGVRQAGLLAERLAREGEQWQGVYCSDLVRASRTASIIGERLGIPVIADSRLRERAFGEAEGLTLPERLARWGENWRQLVPSQESNAQVADRGLSFIEEMTGKHAGESWLVVTHGSFLGQILNTMCRNLDDSHLQNVSLTILEHQDGDWVPLLHNCTVHLNEDAAHAKS